MAQYINTNIAALNAQRNLATSQSSLQTSLQRLSSGLRINSAKDDAAGLAISERFTSQIRGMNQANRNVSDGISLAQTAEGDLGQVGDSLQRMRELAVQAANGVNSNADRKALDLEYQQLSSEIDRLAQNANFNGINLLDGTFQNKSFQVGANATTSDHITMSSLSSFRTSALGTYSGFNQLSLGTIDPTASSGTFTVAMVGGAGATKTLSNVASDAAAIAAAINQSGISGLSASADPNVINRTTAGAATASGTVSFKLNGVNLAVSVVSGNTSVSTANALAAINAQSGNTGVIAKDTGNGLQLTASDGRNISFSGFSQGGATGADYSDMGLGGIDKSVPTTTYASLVKASYTAPDTNPPSAIKFTFPGASSSPLPSASLASTTSSTASDPFLSETPTIITVGGGSSGTSGTSGGMGSGTFTGGALGGFTTTAIGSMGSGSVLGGPTLPPVGGGGGVTPTPLPGAIPSGTTVTLNVTQTGTTIASTDLTTSANATNAIKALDAALGSVNSSRAMLGATQNRFASIAVSLQNRVETMSASRSRIMDADFAAETANLTRSQILQQAGIAMLAQANTLPNGVLSLLRS